MRLNSGIRSVGSLILFCMFANVVTVMDWGQTTIEGRDKFAFKAVCAEFVLARRTADALVGDLSGLHC